MLTSLEAILLGLIQGVTEFLPVSSSGHLALAQQYLGLHETPLLYDVLLHVATLFATIAILRAQVWELLKALPRTTSFLLASRKGFRSAIERDPQAWLVTLIVVSSFVTASIGLLFHDWFKSAFMSTRIVSIGLFITGLILFLSRGSLRAGDTDRKTIQRTRFPDALLIGLAQGCAIMPGISRSGATITTGLFVGLERKFAGEYAFLVSLPAILGALILELSNGAGSLQVPWIGVVAGFFVAFISGAVSLHFLLRWIRSGKLIYFAFYCWLIAAISFFVSF